MGAPDPEWPRLLRDYEAAIAEFDGASRAVTALLADRSENDDNFRALLAAEERARDRVVLARMRLINLWRDGFELPAPHPTAARLHDH